MVLFNCDLNSEIPKTAFLPFHVIDVSFLCNRTETALHMKCKDGLYLFLKKLQRKISGVLDRLHCDHHF